MIDVTKPLQAFRCTQANDGAWVDVEYLGPPLFPRSAVGAEYFVRFSDGTCACYIEVDGLVGLRNKPAEPREWLVIRSRHTGALDVYDSPHPPKYVDTTEWEVIEVREVVK